MVHFNFNVCIYSVLIVNISQTGWARTHPRWRKCLLLYCRDVPPFNETADQPSNIGFGRFRARGSLYLHDGGESWPPFFPQKRKRQLIVTKMSPKWWAPTSYKWSYTPSYPVVRPLIGVSTLLISSRGPPFYESYKQNPFQKNPHAEQETDDFSKATSPGTRNVLWAPLPTLHDLTLPSKAGSQGGWVERAGT